MVERKVYTWGQFTPEVFALNASYHSVVTGDANLDHLVKKMFFSLQSYYFSPCHWQIFWEKYFKSMKMSYISSNF